VLRLTCRYIELLWSGVLGGLRLETNARHVVRHARLLERAMVGLNHRVYMTRPVLGPENLLAALLCLALPLLIHGLLCGLIGALQINGSAVLVYAAKALILACVAGPYSGGSLR
jgi:hypothetical protein